MMRLFSSDTVSKKQGQSMSIDTTQQSEIVYKLLTRADWEAAVKTGAYEGSSDDKRDGFGHLSAAHQLGGTAAKYFRNQQDLLLVAFRCSELGAQLKWETSRGGDLFPHLYAALPAKAAVSVHELELDQDGVPILPEGL